MKLYVVNKYGKNEVIKASSISEDQKNYFI